MQSPPTPTLDPEEIYDLLDAHLTEVFRLLDVTLGARELEHMVFFNRLLRMGLGLPNALAS